MKSEPRSPAPLRPAVERFDFPAVLTSMGARGAATAIHYKGREAIFTQGDPCANVHYVETGSVKLSVVSEQDERRSWGSWGPVISSAREA